MNAPLAHQKDRGSVMDVKSHGNHRRHEAARQAGRLAPAFFDVGIIRKRYNELAQPHGANGEMVSRSAGYDIDWRD